MLRRSLIGQKQWNATMPKLKDGKGSDINSKIEKVELNFYSFGLIFDVWPKSC